MVANVPGGTSVFFPSNGNFEARCAAHEGERCKLTKRSHRLGMLGPSVGGPYRPLGFLCAWLQLSVVSIDKADHKGPPKLNRLAGPEEREYSSERRQHMVALPEVAPLLGQETPTEAVGLDAEPESVA